AGIAVDACATGEGAALRVATTGYALEEPLTARVMTVGAALNARLPLLAGIGLFARLSVVAPVLKARLTTAAGAEIWRSPDVGGALIVGVDGLTVLDPGADR
ncbi:MAG TPA: hypothetical protein VGF99_11720, partial [Myxococcota bacterium]